MRFILLLSVVLFAAGCTVPDVKIAGRTGGGAEEEENALDEWAARYQRFSSAGHPSIGLTAYLKRSGNKPLLSFRFTNHSTNSLTLDPSEFPWGNPHSITLVAITTDGQRLSNHYPIADPPILQKEITIAPNQSMDGDYDLTKIIDFSTAPKGKDIVVFWSYIFPMDYTTPKPLCTGAIVISKIP